MKRKLRKTALAKNIRNKRIDFEDLPCVTVKVGFNMLKWIFLLIFIYVSVSIIILMVQGGDESIRNIVVYSVSGFFTFFMGYFGWMFARSVMLIVSGKTPYEEEF